MTLQLTFAHLHTATFFWLLTDFMGTNSWIILGVSQNKKQMGYERNDYIDRS